MKNKIIALLLVALSVGSHAQMKSGLFFEANLGSRVGGPISTEVTLGPGFHTNGAIGYMFNNFIGIRGQLGFNTFKSISIANEGIVDNSTMLSTNLEALLSVSQLLGFGTEKFDLNIHTGFGFNAFSNRTFKETYKETKEFTDRMFKGSDEVFNIPMGITPTLHINENISVHLDAAYSILFGKANSVDRNIGNEKLEGTSGMSSFSLGLTYRL